MINRDISKLSQTEYDLLIIGGGMYGAALVWEAVSRGLKVLLIEKEDFASRTSGNSLKIIHGGLRYLQTLDIMRTLESIRERKIMLKIAPHLVQPLPCIMPTYGMTMKSKHVMFAGLLLNDMVSFYRNIGIDPSRRLPNGGVVSKKTASKDLPALTDNNYTGAAKWYDAQAYNTERLAFAFVKSAADKGATVLNYVEALDFIIDGNNITGAKVKDIKTGTEHNIKAKMVVTTSGPWTNKLLSKLNDKAPEKVILSKAINLVLKRSLTTKYAVGITSKIEFRDGKEYPRKKRRLLFVTPWRQYTIVGTSHLPYHGETDDFRVRESDIMDLLQELNVIMPDIKLKRSDVTLAHGGVLPLRQPSVEGEDVQLLPHYKIIDHAKTCGLSGLLSIVGVKYTTARDVAEKTMNKMSALFGNFQEFSTRVTPLYGGDIENINVFYAEMKKESHGLISEPIFEQLFRNYGSEIKHIFAFLRQDSSLAQPVGVNTKVIKAQVIHSVRNEFAASLGDVVMRRTELGSGECPDDEALKCCADLMAQELGWDEQTKIKEVELVKDRFIF